MTIIWCMVPEIWSMTERIFCHFGPFFSLFTPNNPENQSFEKMNKTPGDITILHLCTINDNHLMYGSWYMDREDRIFWLWIIFCPFTPLLTQKSKFWKNKKRHLETSSVYSSVPKIMIICNTVPEIQQVTDVIFIFNFGLVFALLPP